MSGFFSQIAGNLMGSGMAPSALPGLLSEIMNPAPGAASADGTPAAGLPGLIQQFQSAGLGAHVQSWLGSGENLPLTAEHVLSAIPADQLDAWGAKVGMNHEQLAGVLAQVLPHAIDHATPDGTVPPDGSVVPDLTGVIGKLFGR